MRATEFLNEIDAEGQGRITLPSGEEVVITIPITINMPSQDGDDVNIDGARRVNTTIAEPASNEMPSEPLWIPPGQQSLELAKQQGGKQSVVINQIVKSDNGPDTDPSDGVFANLDDEDNTDRAPEQSIYAANALNSGWNNDDENSGQRMSGTGEQPEQDTEDDPEDDTDRLIDLIRKLSRG